MEQLRWCSSTLTDLSESFRFLIIYFSFLFFLRLKQNSLFASRMALRAGVVVLSITVPSHPVLAACRATGAPACDSWQAPAISSLLPSRGPRPALAMVRAIAVRVQAERR